MPSPPAAADLKEPDSAPAAEPVADAATDALESHRSRNFFVMAGYMMVQRTGWIFKTESIIMPAVADMLGAGAWLRGCLPLLNRFGLSIPPLVFSRHVRRAPQKRRVLCFTSLLMAGSFLTLALAWQHRASLGAMMAAAFLGLYVLFFMAVGVNQLVFGTLSGKLIRADRRGRLMLTANVIGAAIAIGAACWLLPRWLDDPEDFTYVFGFAGAAFAVSAAMTFLLAEPPDHDDQPRQSLRQLFGGAWRTLRQDGDFRRVAWIGGLFGISFALFPHYQAIALGEMGLSHRSMLQWVVVQNLGTALFSMLLGPLADRRGNRSALRTVLLCVLAAPLLAVSLPHVRGGARLFSLVFLLVGMTPVTLRILHNYVLELSKPEDHPLYLSTMSMTVGVPVMLSPLIAIAVGSVGFLPVFLSVAALVLLAWCLTWGLREPRDA